MNGCIKLKISALYKIDEIFIRELRYLIASFSSAFSGIHFAVWLEALGNKPVVG